MRIIVLDGVPESEKDLGSERNLEDLALVRSISDNLGLDHNIWSTERLGVKSNTRPRLLKLFFHSSRGASLFLRGFNHLRYSNSTFRKIYARYSQSEAERKRLFELRRKARELTQKEGTDYVVYAGILTKKSEIPALKKRLSSSNADSSSTSTVSPDSNVATSGHKPRSKERSAHSANQARKRTISRNQTDGTVPKQSTHERYGLTTGSLREALLAKNHFDWQEKSGKSQNSTSQ